MRFANSKQQTALPEHIKKSVDDVRSSGFWALGLGISGASSFVIGILLFGSRYPNLGHLLGFAGPLAWTVGTVFLHEWLIGRIPLYTFRKSPANREQIEKLIAAGLPYGFYIRDFALESKSVDHFNPVGGSFFSYGDHVENSLVRDLCHFIPFFALMNALDRHESPAAARIYCEDKDWFEAFTHYAGNASLMIINVDEVTSNVRRELDWAFHSARKCAVLIVSTTAGLENIRAEYPGIEEKCWLQSRTGRKTKTYREPSHKVSIPHDVRQFVQRLLVPQLEEIRAGACGKLDENRYFILLSMVCRTRYGGTLTIGVAGHANQSDAIPIPSAESLQTPGGHYYWVIKITIDSGPEPEKIRAALRPFQFKISGPSASEKVEWITTLGDRPEFDYIAAQIVATLNDDNPRRLE